LTSELQQMLYGLQPAQTTGANGQGRGDGQAAQPVDDDVVDAEFDRS
jgi:molecular chaperone DnaK